MLEGRRTEFVFKCDESIPLEKTKPEFIVEENYYSKQSSVNVAVFEVATSVVCLPRMTACEVSTLFFICRKFLLHVKNRYLAV